MLSHSVQTEKYASEVPTQYIAIHVDLSDPNPKTDL